MHEETTPINNDLKLFLVGFITKRALEGSCILDIFNIYVMPFFVMDHSNYGEQGEFGSMGKDIMFDADCENMEYMDKNLGSCLDGCSQCYRC